MTFDILTRLDFDEGNGSPLKGRAYVFEGNFGRAYRNLGSAVSYMGGIVHSSEFDKIRRKNVSPTGAIIWATPEGNRMIDFFGWDFEGFDWDYNPSIRSWVVKNGLLVPGKRGSEITCEYGWDIISEENRHRRLTSNINEYLRSPPKIEWLNYLCGDFAGLNGKCLLDSTPVKG